jgi:4a-hydroxytetrahydrobiopterin dehydratase
MDKRLRKLPGWKLSSDGKRIRKTYRLKHFLEAVAFLNKVTKIAEKMDHHPDVRLYQYRRLQFGLYTHTVGHLTVKDWKLAESIENIYVTYYR